MILLKLHHLVILVVMLPTKFIYLIEAADAQNNITQMTTTNMKESTKVLSRQRRFLIPQASGWVFSATFAAVIPIEGLGASLTVKLPFTYTLDTGA